MLTRVTTPRGVMATPKAPSLTLRVSLMLLSPGERAYEQAFLVLGKLTILPVHATRRAS